MFIVSCCVLGFGVKGIGFRVEGLVLWVESLWLRGVDDAGCGRVGRESC